MPPVSAAPPASSLKEQLVRESSSMVRHLVTNGSRAPALLVQAVERFETALDRGQPLDMAAVAASHERLSRLVAPAKPGTLRLLDEASAAKNVGIMGPVPLVRDLVRLSVACVAVFIVLSVVAVVHGKVGLFTGRYVSAHIVLERVFWLSASAIGASFAMLFQLNDAIVARTYDPDEAPSYWVKFFLGVVAGFILVALVPMGPTGSGSPAPDPSSNGAEALTAPTIALLGGFSALAVYRILTRMVEALESVFSGGTREQVHAAEKGAAARAADEHSQARMALAGKLVDLQAQIAAGASLDEVSAQLRRLTALVMPTSMDGSAELPGEREKEGDAGGEEDAGRGEDAAGEDAAGEDSRERVPVLALVGAPEDGRAP